MTATPTVTLSPATQERLSELGRLLTYHAAQVAPDEVQFTIVPMDAPNAYPYRRTGWMIQARVTGANRFSVYIGGAINPVWRRLDPKRPPAGYNGRSLAETALATIQQHWQETQTPADWTELRRQSDQQRDLRQQHERDDAVEQRTALAALLHAEYVAHAPVTAEYHTERRAFDKVADAAIAWFAEQSSGRLSAAGLTRRLSTPNA